MSEYTLREDAENTQTIAMEREPNLPDLTPLDVFGESRLIGSPPFPPNLLPEVLERHAVDFAERLGVDPAMVALPMLAVCAAAIDDRIQIIPLQNDTRWKESARLWIAVIADSGQKKTPAIKAAIEPVRMVEEQWRQDDKEKMEHYHNELQTHEEAKRLFHKEQARAKAKAVARDDPFVMQTFCKAPLKPRERRKEAKDTTIEKLQDVLFDNPWGMLLFHDELTNWFGSFDAYRQEKTKKDRSFYLESYNGGQQPIDRVARGSFTIANCSLSLIGGIQPEAMRKIAAHLADDGLAQRFITVFTESEGITIDRAEDEEARIAYETIVRDLLTWEIGEPDERVVCRFCPEAGEVRDLINRRVFQVRAMPWVTSAFRTHLSKWEGLFPRFCLTWHCIKHRYDTPFTQVVSLETAQEVAAFMLDYLLPHASRFYQEILQPKEEPHHAKWIGGHILTHDVATITVRDVGRVYPRLRGDTKEIQLTMEYLAAMAWVKPDDNGLGGGHRRWKVNPLVHVKFSKQKEIEKKKRSDTLQRIADSVRDFPILGERTPDND